MKKSIVITNVLLLFVFLTSFNLFEKQKESLNIYAFNFKSNEGNALVSIYKEGDKLSKDPYKQVSCKIANQKAVVMINDLPYGKYAAIVWHDKNNNGDHDHSWGIPTENMAFSNQWKLTLFSGMPNFEKLKFEFSALKNTIEINME